MREFDPAAWLNGMQKIGLDPWIMLDATTGEALMIIANLGTPDGRELLQAALVKENESAIRDYLLSIGRVQQTWTVSPSPRPKLKLKLKGDDNAKPKN